MQQKLRPFDLLEALRGKPIIDEDGSIGHYKFSSENALQGIFHLFQFVKVGHVKNEYVISYREPAEEFENCHWVTGVCGKPINRVIKMAPEKKTVYISVFSSWDNAHVYATAFVNKQIAEKHQESTGAGIRLGIHEITIEL